MYSAINAVVGGTPVTLGASQTSVAITTPIRIASADRLGIAMTINVTAVTGTIEVDLQHSYDGTTWTNVHTTDARLVVTSTGYQYLFVNTLTTNAKLFMPLLPFIRVVATTVSAETITVAGVYLTTSNQ